MPIAEGFGSLQHRGASVPIPPYEQIMLPVLRLAEHGEVELKRAVIEIADHLSLSAQERAETLSSGRLKIASRVGWAKTYLHKAGLLSLPRRGWFAITGDGRELLARSPQTISNATLLAYPAFRAFIDQSPTSSDAASADADASVAPPASRLSSGSTPEEAILDAQAQLRSALRSDLVARILEQTPAFFERLIIDVLVAMRYGGTHAAAAKHVGGPGDGGIDGVIDGDRLGLDRIYLQAKRYAIDKTVGSADIDAFVGALYGNNATKGVFMTTSSFSGPAREKVRHLAMRVALVDGAMLADLMIEHDVGVRVEQTIVIKRIDADRFDEPA